MAVLKQSTLVHINEDLEQIVYKTENTKTPVTGMIGKTKASAVNHQWLVKQQNAVNIDNAAVEGADFVDTDMAKPTRVGNYTQIFTKTINVSRTTRAVDTVGGDELLTLLVDAGVDMKRDIEANIVSNKPSVAPVGSNTAGRLGGIESFITSNVNSGTGYANGGFGAGTVAAPTDGTLRNITEDMFVSVMQKIWEAGGDNKIALVGPAIKRKISATFTGAATKQFDAKDATVYGASDIYTGDFGTVDIVPHLYVRSRTVLFLDPSKLAIATLDKMRTEELAKTADADRKALVTELTLVVKNEKGLGKIADVQ